MTGEIRSRSWAQSERADALRRRGGRDVADHPSDRIATGRHDDSVTQPAIRTSGPAILAPIAAAAAILALLYDIGAGGIPEHPIVPGLAAVILGHFGMHETRRGKARGHGLATAGMVAGWAIIAAVALVSAQMWADR